MFSVILQILLFSLAVSSVSAQSCATDGSSASVSATSSTIGSVPAWAIKASGCPPWDWSAQTTPGKAEVVNYNVLIPKTPIISKNPTKIGRSDLHIPGVVGIMLNGVGIFNDGDRDAKDAYIYEGPTMDQCTGHVAITTYHTHTMPAGCCAFSETGKSHSPFWAVMADGIPVAGPHGDSGVFPSDLDECRGHSDSTYPFYHYHSTSSLEAPYIVGCLKGCILNNFGNPRLSQYVTTAESCQKADKQYDYSSLNLKWDASPVSASTIANCAYKYTPAEPAQVEESLSPSPSPEPVPSPSVKSPPPPKKKSPPPPKKKKSPPPPKKKKSPPPPKKKKSPPPPKKKSPPPPKRRPSPK